MRKLAWAVLFLLLLGRSVVAGHEKTFVLCAGTVAGEDVQLMFDTDPASRAIIGATLRPAFRDIRFLEGKWLDDKQFVAIERKSASAQTARILATYHDGEIRGTWTVAGEQEPVSFTLKSVSTVHYIEIFNDGSLDYEPRDQLSRAIDDGRWIDAAFSANLICGLDRYDCEWPKVVAAFYQPSVINMNLEQKELRALAMEAVGNRAVARKWYLEECARGLRFSCDRALSLTSPASTERQTVVRMACERQRLACSELWGAPEVALIEACERGDEAAVRSILATKVNIAAGGHRLPTPIVAATKSGSLEIVRLLLEHGADPGHIGDGYGRRPLLIAVEQGRSDIAMLLLEHGADPNTSGIYGSATALGVAACSRQLALVRAMLERGADPDNAVTQTDSALICAVDNDDEAMVRLLLRHGASPGLAGKFSLGSALDHAIEAKNQKLIELLRGQQQ